MFVYQLQWKVNAFGSSLSSKHSPRIPIPTFLFSKFLIPSSDISSSLHFVHMHITNKPVLISTETCSHTKKHRQTRGHTHSVMASSEMRRNSCLSYRIKANPAQSQWKLNVFRHCPRQQRNPRQQTSQARVNGWRREEERGKARTSENTHTHAQTPLLSESEISSSGSRNQQWSVFRAQGGGDAAIHIHSWKQSERQTESSDRGRLAERSLQWDYRISDSPVPKLHYKLD